MALWLINLNEGGSPGIAPPADEYELGPAAIVLAHDFGPEAPVWRVQDFGTSALLALAVDFGGVER